VQAASCRKALRKFGLPGSPSDQNDLEQMATYVQVVAEHGPAFSAASLKAMTYLEAVTKETQRRYPIVGGVFRKALKDFELPGGFYVPKVCFTLSQQLVERSCRRNAPIKYSASTLTNEQCKSTYLMPPVRCLVAAVAFLREAWAAWQLLKSYAVLSLMV